MTIWKKAISAVTSAALLASLLATSAFAVKGPVATDSDQTNWLFCKNAITANLTTCSSVADGVSTVVLGGEGGLLSSDATTGTSLLISVTGASIVSAAGSFAVSGGNVIAATGQTIDADDTITLRAPAAAGTAVANVYSISNLNGFATLEGTLTITFTASSGLDVSVANSVVTTRDPSSPCLPFVPTGSTVATGFQGSVKSTASRTANPAAWLCILLRDGNGNAVDTAAGKVAATITPYGLVGGAQTTTTETGSNGIAALQIAGSGLAGTSSITVTVTIGSVTTTFAPVSFTFTGGLSKITLTALKNVGRVNDGGEGSPYLVDKAISFIAEDAAGNRLDLTAGTFSYTYSPSNLFSVGFDRDTTATTSGRLDATCNNTPGTGTVTVKSGTIVSNAVTFNCSNPVKTYSVAFSADTVVPGGQSTITVALKDAGGRPAPDDTEVTILVSSGAIISDNTEAGMSENGEASWTYLAPFNAGVVTVLAYVYSEAPSTWPITTATPQSDTIIVGKPVAPAALGSTASVLGVSTGRGAWSTSTKVAKVGEFITWRFAAGVANAGKTIGVFLQTKNSSGVWSAPVRFSARVADAQGNAYFSWRGTKAMWVSVRGGLDDARSTPPVQGRWQ